MQGGRQDAVDNVTVLEDNPAIKPAWVESDLTALRLIVCVADLNRTRDAVVKYMFPQY
jgi:hypothetical protein